MENNYKVCCLTGHRPKGFPWNYRLSWLKRHREYLSDLRELVENLIADHGFNYFISGCAIGADLDFAEICLDLRDTKYPHIVVEGAIPCDGQELKWSAADKKRYARVMERLNERHYVSHEYSTDCFQKRNEYMVDRSEVVIAVWNNEMKGGTWNTMQYAFEKDIDIEYIFLWSYTNNQRRLEETFHLLIEAQDQHGKRMAWERLKKRLEEEEDK